MANQVQFIQLSQAEYDNISSKNDGSLYFTTDTHRIYKGGDLYASTTFDSLKFEDLSATSIKVDGVDVSLEGHTHTKSDISDFPTNVSSFTNDVGYITQSEVDLTPITSKIPDAASSTNQLADKKFVTDSISTNSATFRGTFDSVSKLPTTGIDNNDYAIIKIETDVNNQTYTRYKYDGTKWVEEFTFNNTPFNSEQWDAINSGITSTTLNDYVKTSDLENVNFENLKATSLTVDGKNVSLEGHTHNVDELDGWKDVELEFGSIEAEEIKVNDKDVSVVGHKHTTADIEGIENIKTGAEVQLKIPSQSLDKTIDKLVVNKLTQSEYDDLKSNGRLNDEELYFVDSNVLDASGNTIPNVATPINATDAATKGYVDTQVEQVRQDIAGIETRVENNVTEYVEQMISEQIGQVLTQEEF